ncbi:hypothetical protein ACET3X_000301 [Alternaria dauci]|uniref:BTB domain-containing protein n=1 Tax=Alternaria dauci TaxID=48095 RepID=A0ABR3UUE9_9PLEO
MASQLQPNANTSVRVSKRVVGGFIKSPLVKVLVGPDSDRSELYIHQSIIVSRSGFFASALGGRWSNSDTNVVDLYKAAPDLILKDITCYLEAVYTNQIANGKHLGAPIEICRVYVVAERLNDVQTRNLAVEALYKRIGRVGPNGMYYAVPSIRCLDVVYRGTAQAKNLMRKLLVDAWRGSGNIHVLEEHLEDCPREFLVELAAAAVRKMPGESQDQSSILDLEAYLED